MDVHDAVVYQTNVQSLYIRSKVKLAHFWERSFATAKMALIVKVLRFTNSDFAPSSLLTLQVIKYL